MKTAKMAPTDEWIKKMWYLYTMEFYSATKNNKILSFTGKWMELEFELSIRNFLLKLCYFLS
jgi:hypothetical protein